MAVHCCLAALAATHKAQHTSLNSHGLVKLSNNTLPADISANILLCLLEDHTQPFKCSTCQIWVQGQEANLARAVHVLSEHTQEAPLKCPSCEVFDPSQEEEENRSYSPSTPPPPINPTPRRRWPLRGSP